MSKELSSFEMGRLLKDLQSKKLDQITAKAYLDQNVFGNLEQSLNQLLETIERNGEFEKYVEMLADRQEREQRMLRRRARETKRLELGDDYQSSDTEESGASESEEESYDDETDNGELHMAQSPMLSNAASDLEMDKRPTSLKSQTNKDDASQLMGGEEIFNPLRFIALHLKELNEIQKANK